MPTLVTHGSPTLNGDSTCTVNSTGSDQVEALATGMNTTQGWFAARLKMGYANTQNNGGDLYWAMWADDINNYIYAAWRNNDGGAGAWSFGRKSGGAGTEGSWLADTFAANAHRTIIMRWDATTWAGSLQGAAFSALGNTNIPTIADTFFNIGSSNVPSSQLNSDFYWFAWGAGTLTDADATAINALGDTDPALASFAPAASVQGVWPCNSFDYSASWALGTTSSASFERKTGRGVSW